MHLTINGSLQVQGIAMKTKLLLAVKAKEKGQRYRFNVLVETFYNIHYLCSRTRSFKRYFEFVTFLNGIINDPQMFHGQ